MSTLNELSSVLRNAGISFPETATVSQLRKLMEQTIGTARSDDIGHDEVPPFPNGSGTSTYDLETQSSVLLNEMRDLQLANSRRETPQTESVPDERAQPNLKPHGDDDQVENVQIELVPVEPAQPNLDDLDIELVRLEKLVRIRQLRTQLASLEVEVPIPNTSSRRVDFADIQHSINMFNGDDSYGIRKWVTDFNTVADSARLDPRDRLIFSRRLMAGSAALFLRSTTADSWETLQQNLIREFDRPLDRRQVYQVLTNRRIRRDESSRQYVLVMQDLARQADISEKELIQFIVDGLGDNSPAVLMLYQASSMADLKEKLAVYDHYRTSNRTFNAARSLVPVANNRQVPSPSPIRINGTSTVASSSPAHRPALAGNPNPVPNVMPDQIRCYNCRQFGHVAANCQREKRPINGCFHCYSSDHQYQQCPKRIRSRTVAAVTPDNPPNEDGAIYDEDDIAAVQQVCVDFEVNGRQTKSTLFSLLDTGSPVSFIRCSLVPSELCAKELTYSGCRGLGNARIYTFGIVNCFITFKNVHKHIHVQIVPDNVLPTPLLLGRDFLKLFDISLRFSVTRQRLNALNLQPEYCHTGDLLNVCYNSYFLASDFITRFLKQRPHMFFCESPKDNILSSNNINSVCESMSIGNENVYALFPEHFESEEWDIGYMFGKKIREDTLSIIERFYSNAEPIEKPFTEQSMHIRLTSDTPFYCSPRRLAYSDRVEAEKIVRNLISEGIVRPSDSPYASPIVLVKKKSGDYRMCVDYRTLNKLTIKDNYPLPLVEYCLEYLDGKSCFSVLDLKMGFHQVKMEEKSIKYTSFVTPFGQYEFTCMPFGLKNGPSVFQRFITFILRDMIENKEVFVYMDDILLATPDPVSHLRLLTKLLNLINLYQLKLKISKCKVMQDRIDYLGYSVDRLGIRPNDHHLSAIKNYPVPTNTKQLHSCLGLFSYFRRFVPGFSRIALPLLNLMREGVPFNFDKECDSAFSVLRDSLVKAPVLAIYSPERETEIHTDASSHGYGAVLLQKQEDSTFRPCAFYSHRTTPAESRLHSFELETLAVVKALDRFGPTVGFSKHIKIVTDCNALALTLAKKDINAKISRWVFQIEQYNYTIVHRKGISMSHVDALSRNHPIVAAITSDEIECHLQATQSRDPIVLEICSRLENGPVEHYELDNGLVYRKKINNRSAFYVPREMENNVIRLVHEKLGHLGVEKCYEQLRVHYWFPGMQNKIKSYIENCVRCIMHSTPSRRHERTLHSIPKAPIPFDTVHIDHLGPLSSIQNKNKHILVVIDSFTKYVKLYPANTTSTKEACAALTKYFESYSRPRRIVSDRGTCFTSLEFSSFILDNNIEHVKNAVAAPQANGQVERVNRVLTAMLGKITEPVNHSNWSRMLSKVEYAINNSFHSSTKQTPSMLLFGVAQRGPEVDKLSEYFEDKNIQTSPPDLSALRLEASSKIEKSQCRNESSYLKRSVPPRSFNEGDFVVIKNVDTTVGRNKKLIPKFRGPYRIHRVLPNDRYVIRDIETYQVTQIPYNAVHEAGRLKPWVQAQNDVVGACFGDKQHIPITIRVDRLSDLAECNN